MENSVSHKNKLRKICVLFCRPNTYIGTLRRSQIYVNTAFGTQRKCLPAVHIICSPYNISQCYKCRKTPEGDYWHNYKDDLDLCRRCRHKIESEIRSCQANKVESVRLRHDLLPYRLVRYCSFLHEHNGTTAAMQLIPTKTLKFKVKKENYLSPYM